MTSEDKMKDAMTKWYLGSMNDGLFIIDTPPRPSTDEAWHDRPDGPTLVLNVAALHHHRAQAIVDAHNAALASRSAATEMESEPDVRPLAGRLARTADAIENPSPAQQKFGAAMHEIAAEPFDWEKRDELRRRIANEPSERPSEGLTAEQIEALFDCPKCAVLRVERDTAYAHLAAHAYAGSDLRTVSAELLRLYDWRKELAKEEGKLKECIEADDAAMAHGNVRYRESSQRRYVEKLLLKYGREKAAAWDRLREVLSRGAEEGK